MSISFLTSAANQGGSVNSVTTSAVAVSGVGKIAIAAIRKANSSTSISGTPTFGGVAMTLLTSSTTGSGSNEIKNYLYYLTNPADGNSALSVSFSDLASHAAGVAVYTGVNTNSPIDVSNNSDTITSTVNNCWHVASAVSNDGTEVGVSGSTQSRSVGRAVVADNNTSVTPAGSDALTFSHVALVNSAMIKPLLIASVSDSCSVAERMSYGKVFSEVISMISITLKTYSETLSISEAYFSLKRGWKNIIKSATTWFNQSKS